MLTDVLPASGVWQQCSLMSKVLALKATVHGDSEKEVSAKQVSAGSIPPGEETLYGGSIPPGAALKETCSSKLFPEVVKFNELSRQSDMYARLTRSLAPNNFEFVALKKRLLFQVHQRAYSKHPKCELCRPNKWGGSVCLIDPNDKTQTPTYKDPKDKEKNSCFYCNDKFASFVAMEDHQKEKHLFLFCPYSLRNKCPQCGNTFLGKQKFKHVCKPYQGPG